MSAVEEPKSRRALKPDFCASAYYSGMGMSGLWLYGPASAENRIVPLEEEPERAVFKLAFSYEHENYYL